MLTVYTLRPHYSHEGLYLVTPNGQTFPGLETVADYLAFIAEDAPELEPAPEAAAEADGRVEGQSGGTVLAWRCPDGTVGLEVVYVE